MQLTRVRRSTLRRFYLYLMTIFLSAAVLFCVVHNQLWSEERLLLDFARTETTQSYNVSLPVLNKDTFYMNIAENEWKQRLPNALIIGIRKGGTRALIDSISRHPDVRACTREVHFFDRQENYQLGLNWYMSQMPLSLHNQITIEKTPAYFVTDDAPRLVFKMSTSVKLLVVVRDPTVRAISDYAQLFDKHHGTLRPFEEYVTEDAQHRVLRTTSAIVDSGVYINHLKKWLEYFPLEQIHFINGEELVKNPVHEMKSVETFLGLEPFIDETLYYFNETKGFPCLVPASQENGKQTVSGCLSETKGRPHPPVNEDVVTMLRDFYRPFNEEFYSAVGKNFGWP
ncbi:heparan sulfate glucosamine 3-O-sulfotransferase 1-like [Oculina patagonica]